MQYLILFIIVVVTTISFLTEGNRAMVFDGWLPNIVGYLPEIISLLIFTFVIVYGTRDRFQYVRPAYWLTFGALVICIIFGVVVNDVETGPIVAGMRKYLRAIPLFFLPAVVYFNDRQVRGQLLLLLMIAVFQVPLAVYQRFASRAMGSYSGDMTSGTFMISSILSIFLVCAACLVTAFYLRKKLSFLSYLFMIVLLLIPTTVNETKGTLLLIPLAVLTVFFVGTRAGTRLRNLVVGSGVLAVFVAIFVPIYDHFIADHDTPIAEFVADQDRWTGYLYSGAQVGQTSSIGRVDAVIVPIKLLSKDPPKLAFGLGIGNATESALGRAFTGRYFAVHGSFLIHSFAMLLLEIGALGVCLVLLLYWLIFRDSWVVAHEGEDTKGVLALAWTGVTVVMVIAIFYKNIIVFESLSYLFWFYSGLIAAERVRLARAEPLSRSAMVSTAEASKIGIAAS